MAEEFSDYGGVPVRARPRHVEREIEELEARLGEKRKELSLQKEAASEREMLKETIKGHAEQERPGVLRLPQVPSTPASVAHEASIQELQALPEERRVEALLNLAFSKSIYGALHIARALNDAYLLDAFHDALVDRLFEELVRRGKLNAE